MMRGGPVGALLFREVAKGGIWETEEVAERLKEEPKDREKYRRGRC